MKKQLLAKLVEIQTGYRARRKIIESPTGTHRLLQARDISGGYPNFNGAMKFDPELDAARYRIHPKDILFIARGYENKAYFIEELPDNILASNTFYILHTNTTIIHPAFLAWWLNQNKAQDYFSQFQVKSGFSYMSKKNLDQLKVPIPLMKTQNKIVEIQQLWGREKHLVNEIKDLKTKLINATCSAAVNQKES